MRILITNDDGFLSPGLMLLYKALMLLGDIKIDVVVPEKPQSAGGLAITLHKPLRVKKVTLLGVEMYVISGKPCDAVVYAFTRLSDKYDLVVSGINLGENTSLQAILASGTIAPCVYASLMYRVPGLAFSVNSYSIHDLDSKTRRKIMHITAETARYVLEHGRYPDPLDVVSVNFPHVITDDSKVVLCDVAEYKFVHDVVRHVDPRGLDYYWIHGYFVLKPDLRLDASALHIVNEIVITGLTFRRMSILRDYDKDSVNRAISYLKDLVNYLNESMRSARALPNNLV